MNDERFATVIARRVTPIPTLNGPQAPNWTSGTVQLTTLYCVKMEILPRKWIRKDVTRIECVPISLVATAAPMINEVPMLAERRTQVLSEVAALFVPRSASILIAMNWSR
eukprot:6190997-Pleurochrysis_carterae.AAC.4